MSVHSLLFAGFTGAPEFKIVRQYRILNMSLKTGSSPRAELSASLPSLTVQKSEN
jgi:hypothetical protein